MSVRLTPSLVRAARGLVGWNEEELASRSGVPQPAILSFEGAGEARDLDPASEKAVTQAFENAGVVFVAENGGGAGVRMRERADGEDPSAATLPVEDLNSSNDK